MSADYHSLRAKVIWDRLAAYAASQGVEIVEKRSSKLMWLAYYAALMPLWNREFMTKYATAGVNKVWMPKEWFGTATGWMVLAHELVHHANHKKTNLVWKTLSYFFPQILAPLGLLGLLGLAWWPLYFLFLLLPLFLLPLFPAVDRIEEELSAYAMSVAVFEADLRDIGFLQIADTSMDRINNLTSSGYFWPALLMGEGYKKGLARDLRQRADLLPSASNPIYIEVITALAIARRMLL
jgi:hypothetical protein